MVKVLEFLSTSNCTDLGLLTVPLGKFFDIFEASFLICEVITIISVVLLLTVLESGDS